MMMIAAERTAMTEYITASEARSDFRGTLNRVVRDHERLVITRHNDEEAALIPVEDLRRFEALERQTEDLIDSEAARRVLADANEERESWEDVRRDLGL
jgi:prevent-host-death family protein